MDYAANIIGLVNLFFAIVIGLYFWNLLRSQQSNRVAVDRESRKEMEKLQRLRSISLTEPLSEKTRPVCFDEIIGQSEGIKALRAALCGPNPQHVIIYGPPGIGKTAAARIVLEEAKKNPLSPFSNTAKFVELDATSARFDDRGIADPLIGSVHDPIYQGAGPLGIAGIPQPKPGAVTKAHGGILFIDEIGELHHVQMNKLLKVLEDRKVFLESSYYSTEDANIPSHIHDIFQNGLPADFRLIGATTRMPQDIPPAIRSRCVEIFFRPLLADEVGLIARNAARKVNLTIEEAAVEVIMRFATNGREAVNMVQLATGMARSRRSNRVTLTIVEKVVQSGDPYRAQVEATAEAIVADHSYLAEPFFAAQRLVGLDDLAHLGLDRGQVFLGKGAVLRREVVIEAIVDDRADRDLGLGIQLLDRVRQQAQEAQQEEEGDEGDERDGHRVRDPVPAEQPDGRQGEEGQDERDNEDRRQVGRVPEPEPEQEDEGGEQQELRRAGGDQPGHDRYCAPELRKVPLRDVRGLPTPTGPRPRTTSFYRAEQKSLQNGTSP